MQRLADRSGADRGLSGFPHFLILSLLLPLLGDLHRFRNIKSFLCFRPDQYWLLGLVSESLELLLETQAVLDPLFHLRFDGRAEVPLRVGLHLHLGMLLLGQAGVEKRVEYLASVLLGMRQMQRNGAVFGLVIEGHFLLIEEQQGRGVALALFLNGSDAVPSLAADDAHCRSSREAKHAILLLH